MVLAKGTGAILSRKEKDVAKKILITGGSGFIGYFVAKALSAEKSNTVTIIDDLSRGVMDADFETLIARDNVHFIQAYLTDRNVLSGLQDDYDYVYHFAAIIGVKNVTENPDKVLYVNALTALNLFEYAKASKAVKKIYFASTSEVYAGSLRHGCIDFPTNEEVVLAIDDIHANRTTYAVSKIFGESAALVYGRKYDIPVTVGRYHNIYGPRMGCAHVIPETFFKIAHNTIIDVPSPTHTRAFCFIDDAVEFTIRACECSAAKNEIVHIGNRQEEVSVRDLVMTIARVMGKNITINELPDTPGSPIRRCPDTSKVEKLTGYQARISLEEGVRRSYEWYKEKLINTEDRETCQHS